MSKKQEAKRKEKVSAEELNPNDFIVPAHDLKGHSDKLQLRLMPGYLRQMEVIVQSKRYIYKTTGDFVRHAIARHVEWIESIDGELESVTGELDMMAEVVKDKEFEVNLREGLDDYGKRIADCMASGEEQEARSMVQRAINRVKRMKNTAWKRRYENDLKRRWPNLLKPKPEDLVTFDPSKAKEK